MASGAPDYLAVTSANYSLQYDMSSLIASLGGVQSIDGRGRPIYVDDFRSGLRNWSLSSTGNGSVPRKGETYKYCYLSGLGCEMVLGAHSSTSLLFKYLASVASGKIGVETIVYLAPTTGSFYLRIDWNSLLGRAGYARFNLRPSSAGLEIVDALGTQLLETIGGAYGYTAGWYPVKMVIDVDTGYYVGLQLGKRVYDLSAYQMNSSVDDATGSISIEAVAYTAAGNIQNVGLGYFILTLDEP